MQNPGTKSGDEPDKRVHFTHADEQIITALPEIQIQVGGAKRASEVAAQFDLPTKEVEKMMAAYWGQSTSTSPIEQRVALLERYWSVFDTVHAKQQSGMLPLWGFAEDHLSFDFYHYFQSNIPYQSGLYQQILPHDMQLQIEQLWGTTMLRRWPEHIVSEPLPYERMLETLGPALRFWDGCALTAWFICEGPYARTDLAGLAEYHWQELQMLEQWGTPIPPRLFDDLIRAEGRLGPPQPITKQSSTLYSSQGISTTISMNYGSRRNGFEMVRDIITHYRRTWSATYLKTYLRLLWENEIRAAGKAYNLLLNKIGKAPTAKKLQKMQKQQLIIGFLEISASSMVPSRRSHQYSRNAHHSCLPTKWHLHSQCSTM